MTIFLSAKHARNNIALLWKHSGFANNQKTLGENVYKEFNQDVFNNRLASLYVFVDEYIALHRYIAHYFSSGLGASDPAAIIFYRLSIRQLRTIASIRALCGFGLDSNARLQLRLLYETSLIWTRCRIDPVARKEFEEAITPKSANNFWHKYLSKDKNEEYIRNYCQVNGYTWYSVEDPVINEFKTKMSLVAHPTMLHATHDAIEDWQNTSGFVVNCPSESSFFTLSMTIFAAALPFMLKPEVSYGFIGRDLRNSIDWFPLHNEDLSWDEYNLHIRDMIPTLFVASTRFTQELSKEANNEPNLG